MKSVLDSPTRDEILGRLARLSADQPARWGRMSAPQMVAHLIESCRLANGELSCVSTRLPIRFYPINQLLVYYAPFPRNAPTAPELLARAPGVWERDVADLRGLVTQVASRSPRETWPEHPAFGHLSGQAWGVLVYRHVDHHLQQFGV